ncbi:MFS transporter [Trinickia terrae]|uniref:MFS transporter n=1 Tax=Trinickia terrae TaxID=2571161 RepID=A0A4U1IEW7_9BURK|nr:MFS transporter [Trinickia terrae]TKC92253.1 MFS transporter [Trinickia terrae]
MRAKNRGYENLLLVLLFFTVGSVFFDRLSINFLFPFMREDFALTNSRIGMVTSALALTWAVSGVLLGAYADQSNRRKPVLIATVIVFSLCSFFSGLAGTFAALVMARALMGLAEGPILPVSQSLMAFASSESRRGFNMGFIQASAVGLLGAVLAPAVIVPLASTHGWRFAFYCAGIPGLVLAILLAMYIREPAVDEKREFAPLMAQREMPFTRVLMSRNIVICIIMSCLFITWFLAIAAFGPAYLIERRHFSPAQMSIFMTVLGISSVIAGFAVPALSDRIGRKPTLIAFSAVAVCAPLVIGYFQGTFVILCVAIFVAYLGYGCSAIFIATIPAESVPRYFIGRTVATVIGTGEVLGGFISPMFAGFSADKFGPAAPFVIAAASAALAVFASCFLRETAPRKDRLVVPVPTVASDPAVG